MSSRSDYREDVVNTNDFLDLAAIVANIVETDSESSSYSVIMENQNRSLAICGLTLILALYVVGIESHGIIRHFVQTAPVWPAVWLGFRGSRWTKWAALSPLFLWLVLMINIWMLLLGLPHLLSGNFTPVEIVLTIIIGAAAVVGIVTALRLRTAAPRAGAVGMLLLMACLQLLAIWVSFQPGINRDPW
jgi:hypothetical protein